MAHSSNDNISNTTGRTASKLLRHHPNTMAREDIVKSIRLVWESMDSHLDASVKGEEKKPCCQKAVGLPPFHRKCVKEYAEIIKTLADQL